MSFLLNGDEDFLLFCGNRFQMEKRMRMKKVKEVQIQVMTGD
jgi:hypothetical protein